MSNKTSNYGLIKPLPEEFYDIDVQNQNMDIIDEALVNRDQPMSMGGHKITNVAEPTDGSDVATRNFVERHSIAGNTYVAVDYNNDGHVVIKPYVADEDELVFYKHINDTTIKAGDILPVTVNTAGILTSNGSTVQFTIPLSKMVVGNPKITPECINGFMLLQNGNYTHGSSSSARAFPDTFTATLVDGVGVRLVATFSDKTNVTNNDTIAIYWHGRLIFEEGN